MKWLDAGSCHVALMGQHCVKRVHGVGVFEYPDWVENHLASYIIHRHTFQRRLVLCPSSFQVSPSTLSQLQDYIPQKPDDSLYFWEGG